MCCVAALSQGPGLRWLCLKVCVCVVCASTVKVYHSESVLVHAQCSRSRRTMSSWKLKSHAHTIRTGAFAAKGLTPKAEAGAKDSWPSPKKKDMAPAGSPRSVPKSGIIRISIIRIWQSTIEAVIRSGSPPSMEWRGQVRQSRAEAVIRSGGPPSREWTRPERAAGWALGSMRLDCTQD